MGKNIDGVISLLENIAEDTEGFVEDLRNSARLEGTKLSAKKARDNLLNLLAEFEKNANRIIKSGGDESPKANKIKQLVAILRKNISEAAQPEPSFMDPSRARSMQDRLMDQFNLGKLTPEQFKARMQEMTAAAHVGIGRKAGKKEYYEDGYRDIPSLCKANNTTHWWDDGLGHIGVLNHNGSISWYRMTPAGYSLVGRTRGTGGAKEHNLGEGG